MQLNCNGGLQGSKAFSGPLLDASTDHLLIEHASFAEAPVLHTLSEGAPVMVVAYHSNVQTCHQKPWAVVVQLHVTHCQRVHKQRGVVPCTSPCCANHTQPRDAIAHPE